MVGKMNIQKIDPNKFGERLWLGNYYIEPNIIKPVYSVAYKKTKRVLLIYAGDAYGYYHTGSPNFWAKDEGVVFDSFDEASLAFADWYNKISLTYHSANVNNNDVAI